MTVKVRRIVKVEVDAPDLHEVLEKARIASKKSVSQLCREADFSRNYWYNLVNNKEEAIAETTLRKLEAILGFEAGVEFND